MVIPYWTAKFKSTNILAIATWAQLPNLIPANISGYTVLMHVSDSISASTCTCMHDKEIYIKFFFCRDAYQGALSEEEMASLEQAARDKSNALALIEDREERDTRHQGRTNHIQESKPTLRLKLICLIPQGHFVCGYNILNLAKIAICLIFAKNCTREY